MNEIPDFDINNYRINRIMKQYKYLDEERKTRNILKKKFTKLLNVCLKTLFYIMVLELGIVETSIAVPTIMLVSAPMSVVLTIFIIISK